MPKFTIVNDFNEVDLDINWKKSFQFNSENRIVDEKGNTVSSTFGGKKYVLYSKVEKKYTSCERFQRGLVGTIAVVFTLGLALFSKSVSHLFTKDKMTRRFGIDPIKKQCLYDYTPPMVKALGGVDKVMKLPIITDWDGDLKNLTVDAPISRGTDASGAHYLIFHYVKLCKEEGKHKTFIEYLRREKGCWVGMSNWKSQLDQRVQSINVKDGSLEELQMYSRIENIVNYPVVQN